MQCRPLVPPRPVPMEPLPLPAGAFPWGVISGDPQPDSVSLWTKVRPNGSDLLVGFGRAAAPVQVTWQVAADERFSEIAAAGTVTTDASRDHSVKVTAGDLDPDRHWFYRFIVDSAISATGRSRTAPAADSSPERLRIAFLSCQMYSEGYFTAYRHLLDEDVDMVLHLGDYIMSTELPARSTDLIGFARIRSTTQRPWTDSDPSTASTGPIPTWSNAIVNCLSLPCGTTTRYTTTTTVMSIPWCVRPPTKRGSRTCLSKPQWKILIGSIDRCAGVTWSTYT